MAKKAAAVAVRRTVITEAEITKYFLDRKHYLSMKKEFEEFEARVKGQEKDLIGDLEAGAKVNSKVYRVAVDYSMQRRLPDWKAILNGTYRALGLDPEIEREKVIQATEPTVYPKLVVDEVG